jgi:hypothetical protein
MVVVVPAVVLEAVPTFLTSVIAAVASEGPRPMSGSKATSAMPSRRRPLDARARARTVAGAVEE